jgi:hypothetical protein
MSVMKRLAQGFAAMSLALGASNVVALVAAGKTWLGILYLLVLAIPLSASVFLLMKRRKNCNQKISDAEKVIGILFACQGAALACWAFDNATTFYAIDIARVATELNPLGWPLGALGALVYYIPTLFLTYVLLFRIGQKQALYAAVGVTVVSLYMGIINLTAGALNFKIFMTFASASIPVELRSNLIAIMATIDLIYAITLATFVKRQLLNPQQKLDKL